MNLQQKASLTLVVFFLSIPIIATASSFVEKGVGAKSNSSAVHILGPDDSLRLQTGPTGPTGDAGPGGPTGPKGPIGPKGIFDHQYATAYLSASTPLAQRSVSSVTGFHTVQFDQIGPHSDKTSFNPSSHRLSLASGVYTLSFQCMLHAESASNYFKIDKLLLMLHPLSGTPLTISINRVHGDIMNTSISAKLTVAYTAKTVFTIPDDQEYSISLVFHKYGVGVWHFNDPDIPSTYQTGYGNPARITVMKIAEYEPELS